MITKYKIFLNQIQFEKRFDYLVYIASILDKKLELYEVLSYFGVQVSKHSDEEQIPCILPSHGTKDNTLSARYYKESNINAPRMHCFKCQKTLSAFWLYYAIQKDSDKKQFEILIEYIETFKIVITTEFYNFNLPDKKEEKKSVLENIKYFQALKNTNFTGFCKELELYIDMNFKNLNND